MAWYGQGSFNGFSWGPLMRAMVTSLDLDDSPPVRSSDATRAGDHGDYAGVDLVDGRTVAMDVLIGPDANGSYFDLLESAKRAFQPGGVEQPLLVNDSTRLLNCRVRKRAFQRQDRAAYGLCSLELFASDPRIYDANLQTIGIAVAVASGGRTYPRTYPLTFGTAGSGGTFQATNGGNFGTRPTAHIVGPVDLPRIEHTDLGKHLTFNLSLGPTDYLDIDFKARTVTLNGTASRRSSMTSDSQWFELVPGINNLRYAANTVQVGSVCTFTFRSAWI